MDFSVWQWDTLMSWMTKRTLCRPLADLCFKSYTGSLSIACKKMILKLFKCKTEDCSSFAGENRYTQLGRTEVPNQSWIHRRCERFQGLVSRLQQVCKAEQTKVDKLQYPITALSPFFCCCLRLDQIPVTYSGGLKEDATGQHAFICLLRQGSWCASLCFSILVLMCFRIYLVWGLPVPFPSVLKPCRLAVKRQCGQLLYKGGHAFGDPPTWCCGCNQAIRFWWSAQSSTCARVAGCLLTVHRTSTTSTSGPQVSQVQGGKGLHDPSKNAPGEKSKPRYSSSCEISSSFLFEFSPFLVLSWQCWL